MRSKISLIVGFMLMSFVLTSSYAYAMDSKIGFINLREIMLNTNAGKKAGEDFKKIVDKKREGIIIVERDLKNIKEKLDKQGSIMTVTARQEERATYERKLRDYQLLVDDTNKELKRRDEEIASKLIPEIIKVVSKVAERERYTLVIDIASMPVPYHAKESDFSKKVIEEFNKLPNT